MFVKVVIEREMSAIAADGDDDDLTDDEGDGRTAGTTSTVQQFVEYRGEITVARSVAHSFYIDLPII